MSDMFEIIGNTVLAYGASLAPDPVMKIRFIVEPTPSDVGLSEWQVNVALECYGEIVDGKPKLLDAVLWEGHGTSMPNAMTDLHQQLQTSVVKRFHAIQAAMNVLGPVVHEIDPAVTMAEACDNTDYNVIEEMPGSVIEVAAVLRPR